MTDSSDRNTGFCPRGDRNNIELFTSCLTFTPHSPQECMCPQQKYERSKEGKTQKYAPPMSEFDMLATSLKAGEKETLDKAGGPGILLITKGSGQMKANGKEVKLHEGACYFVAHGVELQFEAGSEGLLSHLAFVE